MTDRDFRRRVLAAGRGPETPVLEVYSAPLKTVSADCPIYEAWRILLDSGSHHLPVSRGGDIIGVLSATDLLKCTAAGPVAVMKRVERLGGRDALPGYSEKVAEMASSLFNGGLEPTVIGGFVARLNDTLITRILRWAEAELGPPPTPYAWLVFGSEGRMEQMVLTDQDNALVWGEDVPGAREYFAELAEKAIGDLVAAGFPRCPGGYMSTKWLGGLDWWEERFRSWLEKPTPQALLEASIFFDFRAVHGHLDVSRLRAVTSRAARRAHVPVRDGEERRHLPAAGRARAAAPERLLQVRHEAEGDQPDRLPRRACTGSSRRRGRPTRSTGCARRSRAGSSRRTPARRCPRRTASCSASGSGPRSSRSPRGDPRRTWCRSPTCRRWSAAGCATRSGRSRSGRSARRTTTATDLF